MTLKQTLQNFGLDEKEAKVYLAVLELSQASILEIAKKAELHRPHVYNIIDSLLKRGLITQTLKGKRTLYAAEDPKKLVSLLREKEKEIMSVLPELRSIYNLQTAKPKIRFYEGKEGLIKVLKESIECQSKELRAFGQSALAHHVFSFELFQWFYEERAKRGIQSKLIITESKEAIKKKKLDAEYLTQTKLIKDNKLNILYQIYDNKTVFYTFKGDIFAIVIESDEIATGMKLSFDMIWGGLED